MTNADAQPFLVSVSARSHVGLVRTEHQDALVVNGWVGLGAPQCLDQQFQLTDGDALYVSVIDGMGGHAGGAEAAALVATGVGALANTPREELAGACEQLSDRLANAGRAWGTPDMGATMALLVIADGEARVSNIGDCRVAQIQGAIIGELTVEDRAGDPRVPGGSVVTQAFGGRPRTLDPHYAQFDLLDGTARYLLSSDGLHHVVPAHQVVDAIRWNSPIEAADELISLALHSGAPDNVSVIVVDVHSESGAS